MESLICQSCNESFTIEADDFSFYEKIKVPPPTFCPECRMRRRLAWRNEKGLYKRKCDAPGHSEMLISMYAPEEDVVVYDHQYWHSDEWDPLSYGIEYNFDIPFFNQFQSLLKKVPLLTLFDSKSIETSYCNITVGHKNCYFVSAGWDNEDCLLSNRISYCRDTCDSYVCHKTEFSYQNIYCKDSNRLFYSQDCESCTDSYFLYDCRNCSNCIGCVNLRNKSYCIFNQQLTKEEYLKWTKENDLSDRSNLLQIQDKFKNIYNTAIHRFAHLINTKDCTGDHLENSSNCKECYDLAGEVQNAKYCNWGTYGLIDSYDTGPGTGGKSELTYEGISIGVANSSCTFGVIIWNCQNVHYSFGCQNCKNCFGCVSLRGKEYCIFNKQYSKEEYETLLPQIINHMNLNPYADLNSCIYKYGEFFPIELSPFAYNATVAQDYLPISKEIANKKHYQWYEKDNSNYKITLENNRVPNTIKEVDDSILDAVISCQNNGLKDNCTKAFRIVSKEFDFYKRLNIPLPIFCPNCRHAQRLEKRNPMKLWHRQCMCGSDRHDHTGVCSNEFETSYAPGRPEKVYCESCYQKEVF